MKQTTLCMICLCLLVTSLRNEKLMAQVTRADYLRADTIMKCSNLVYSPAIRPEWIDSSHYFWYKNHEKEGDFYYLVNAENGKKQRATDKKGLAAFFSKKQKNLAESLLKEEEKEEKRWQREGEPTPVISPDKKWEAYIKDNNLYISPVQDKEQKEQPKEEIALSMDGSTNLRYDGWSIIWSPDSRKLATVKIRDVQERRIPLLESSPATQRQPILQWRDYAKPGDVIPIHLPVLFDVETRKQIPVETSLYENQYYLYLTGWREDSRAFSFEFNQRGHQRYIIGEVNATDGSVRHLIDEQVKTFIYYYNNYRKDLNDGKELLWISERDGWRHLYLINGTNGEIKQQVTKGEWVVRQVDYVDEANRMVYFTASGFNKEEDPYNLHYCRIRLDGTGFEDMTPENGNHTVVFSADRQYFTDVYSRPDLPPVSQLKRTTDASVVTELQRCDIRALQAKGWIMPEVFSAKGRDGKTDIWGNIYRPMNFDNSKRYPVVEMIYAGPHDSHVDKDFKPTNHLISKLVELGFIVVSIDGMGTSNRSKAFHDVCWKNLKDAGFPDRIAWIKAAAAKYTYMDLDRVGIYGWSAGGQNAMAALLFHNDFYKVAVALCGCHDNRMDKIWWNEQWMGYPLDESYSASSNVDNAHLLKGKLLLINGELDDNVDPASTLQVVSALMKANKNFEQLYLPGKTHSLGGPFEMHKMHDFFVKHLLNQEPPAWE
ncbi:MAG: prolyl oligopeptidase family serine peptidase [Parabacteroides sp.]|nr:prolyl oligopeptidase family serine peptidase [Parabacteroides sp.]